MKAVSYTENTIASEAFLPKLSNEYTKKYQALIMHLNISFPTNRISIIRNEIADTYASVENIEDNIEALKYVASLQVLIDLSQQGWVFDFTEDQLTLKMGNDNLEDKAHIRYRLSAERNAQFRTQSVKRFIHLMEKPKSYNGEIISIRNLIGDPQFLIQRIRNSEKICEPYIQIVSNRRDDLTGYRISDIWRYFRYTWSIPYKTMPGRNIFYLVRDALQPHHPVIGIFALGNSVLNLTVRDDDIGWTVDAIKRNMERKMSVAFCDQTVGETDGGTVRVKVTRPEESEAEYEERIVAYANMMLPLLINNINDAINDIYVKDLGYHRQTKYPKQEYIDRLSALAAELSIRAINNKNNEKNPNWEDEARTTLFKRKRASELAKLLTAKSMFTLAEGVSNADKLRTLLSTEKGRQAINTALIANRKRKIGSNMMEIIVCGSIPPYNELLGGKLISILACSPVVIKDYTERYQNQVSEIASRMKGKEVIRDSHLAFLGTTSLYSVGSSQYNRIKVPLENGRFLQYRKMGITEGYGTVYFSSDTTALFSRILELQDGGKRINHVFGEGTSPRFRMISRGLNTLGIRSDAFLKHYSPRIVYSIDLAKNTKDFLLGLTNELDYGFDISNPDQVNRHTQMLIDYWYDRWLLKRLTTVDIEERLTDFNAEEFLLSNYI